MACCPCRLKIEATGDPIDVQHLTGKIELRYNGTLHGEGGNLFQRNATGRNKFFLEGGFPTDLVTVVRKQVDHSVLVLLWDLGPNGVRGDSGLVQNKRPESFGQREGIRIPDLLAIEFIRVFCEELSCVILAHPGQPIDLY